MHVLLLLFLLLPQAASGEISPKGDPASGGSLTPVEITRIEKVITLNQELLGAQDREYCPRGKEACLQTLRGEVPRRLIRPFRIESLWPESKAGSEWPTRIRPRDPRRLQVRVHWQRGAGTASRSVPLLIFSRSLAEGTESCVFPIEHWEWSAMDRPERFAMAPQGICGEKQLNVVELLLSLDPDRPIWAIRFLSPEEGQKWIDGSSQDLRREGTWTAGYPYAKFFFLESMRWWRGGDGKPSTRYNAAVRFPDLPLRDLQRLSRSGEAFLDLYEEGAQVELTIVNRKGLEEALRWPIEFLIDQAPAHATRPDLQPAPPPSRSRTDPGCLNRDPHLCKTGSPNF
ncbi:MAG: hypothetical protein P8K76_00320 [Candidatus Binatia bacterium]|nr:hypothetical protein [Candidatus Binatia bacterium]MDG1958227.1 hypothetical protein [Candidatus Binatia bacterium]MDG2008197.1 hypothetical protein [Candidatus Binatia bacterium]